MFNNRGRRGRGRGRGKNNINNNNKNNNEDVQALVDYLPQNVIRKRRTSTPKKNLGIGKKRTFDNITELEADFFKDVEEADDLPENYEIPGPIPDLVGLYTYPLDVAYHRLYKRRRSDDGTRRSVSRKENEVISATKERETTPNSNSKMGITVSDHLSMGSAHVQNNGTGTSGEKIQESNSNPKPWILKYETPRPISDNLDEIMSNQSLFVNFWVDIDDCNDSDNE